MPAGGIVLAAGTSSRLGRPKQLLELDGKIVLQHVIDSVAAAELDEIVVVLGHEAEQIESRLWLPTNARAVRAADYLLGQSASLKAGLEALSSDTSAAVVVLGDQPRTSPESIRLVLEKFRDGAGPIVQASYAGTPGHPVLFDRKVFDDLRKLEGDIGARDLIKQNPNWVTRVEIGTKPPSDIDTPDDFEKLRGR